MSWSDAEVAGVELVGDTNLGRGRGRANGAWPRWEVRVRAGARGKGAAADGEICHGVEVRSALRSRRGRGAKRAGDLY
jgi:hypothetical protein